MKRDKWKDLLTCKCFAGSGGRMCGCKVTHVVFLNTSFDKPYVVGVCSRHKNESGGFPYVTLVRFNKTLEELKKKRVREIDLPVAMGFILDPVNQDEFPDCCPICVGYKHEPFQSGDFICKHKFHDK